MAKMKIKKKELYVFIGVVAVAVVLIATAILNSINNPGSTGILNPQNQDKQNEKKAEEPGSGNPATGKTGTIPTSTLVQTNLSYQQAISLYEGRRFQFTFTSKEGCEINPYYATFKEGTNIMLDNRENRAITVYLDGIGYNIGAYNFKIVRLSTLAQLIHTINVNCDKGKNNGQIMLQQ